MKRKTVVAVALAGALVGCGGDDGDGRATTVTPQQSSEQGSDSDPQREDSGALSQAELEAALLTVSDLPTGYRQGMVTPDDEDTPTESDNPECAQRFEELEAADEDGVAKAEAAFEGPELGSILEQSLESYEDEDKLSQQFENIAAVLSECPSFSMTDEAGETTTVTIGALSFPELGDETLAFGAGLETSQFSGTLNFVAVRVGSAVQLIAQGGLTADVAALEQAARAGTEKLQAAG